MNNNKEITNIGINQNCLNNKHQQYNIEFYCETCNNIPICKECIPIHNKHSIQIYSNNDRDKIIQNFKSSINNYQNEIDYLYNEIRLLEEHLTETQLNSNEKIRLIEEEFKKLHTILQIHEIKLKDQIKTVQSENQEEFIIKKSIIENKIQVIDKMIYKFNSNNNSNYNNNELNKDQLIVLQNQHIEISKFNQIIIKLNKKIPPFNNINKPFKHIDLVIDNSINNNDTQLDDISLLLDNQNDLQNKFSNFFSDKFSIEISYKLKYMDYFERPLPHINFIVLDNMVKWLKNKYYDKIYIDTIISNEIKSILLVFLNINLVPTNIFHSINTLILCNINEQLKVGSIPLVKYLYINQYQFSLPKGVIPHGVEVLILSNLKQSLKNIEIPPSVLFLSLNNINGGNEYSNSDIGKPRSMKDLILFKQNTPFQITSSVKHLILGSEFNYKLGKGINLGSIENLSLYNIEKTLEIGSIPPSVTNLHIQDGFNHKLSKGIIPETVEYLSLYDIQQPIDLYSIPSSVRFLSIRDGFKFKIGKDTIPNSVHSLSLYNIQQPIDSDSIPPSVKRLHIHKGFKHQLSKSFIPKSVESLSIFNIKQPLEIGSIPLSVKNLQIHNGFKHQLTQGIIPNSVESLSIYDIHQPLEIGSIPLSVKQLLFQNGFNQNLDKDIIPEGVEQITINSPLINLNNISIPNSVKTITIQNDNIIINNNIINNNFRNIKNLYLKKELYYTINKSLISKSIDINIINN